MVPYFSKLQAAVAQESSAEHAVVILIQGIAAGIQSSAALNTLDQFVVQLHQQAITLAVAAIGCAESQPLHSNPTSLSVPDVSA